MHARVDDAELLLAYANGARHLRSALQGLTRNQLVRRVRGPDTWSIMEIALHVVDAEIVGSSRIRFALAEPGSRLAVYEQDDWARELGYQEASGAQLDEAVNLFESIRTVNARLVRQHADRWDRSAVHATNGVMSVRDLVRLYTDHLQRHVAQIAESRRQLAAPIEVAT